MALYATTKLMSLRNTLLRCQKELVGVAMYHKRPKDKKKQARRWAAHVKEKQEAVDKHQPFKEGMSMTEVVSLLRIQAKQSVPTEQDVASLVVDTVEATVPAAAALPLANPDIIPYQKPQRKCIICDHKIKLDYKNVRLLSQFVSPFTGRIYGASITGLCVPMQSRVGQLIKRARRLGLMPIILKDPKYMEDPELYNPFTRSH